MAKRRSSNIVSPAIRTKPLRHADCGGILQLIDEQSTTRQCDRCGALVEMGLIEQRKGITEVRYPKRRETLGQARQAISGAEWLSGARDRVALHHGKKRR